MSKSIFAKRINIVPYEYPDLLDFKDAIRHSYWLHTEFNITPDVQDFKANLTEPEKTVIKRTVLSISQVEVGVKRFWGNIYNHFPKPEIDDVGGTFAESEIRHKDAYKFILEKLGLSKEFEKIFSIPAIIDRHNYLDEFMSNNKSEEDFVLQLILFSLLTEHISLFGHFYTIMAFNKRQNNFKGLSNIVEATSKEEDIHGKFGIKLYEIISKERPEYASKEFQQKVINLCNKALKAELKILDWIFEMGDLSFLTKSEVYNFVIDRFNKALFSININHTFEVDNSELSKTNWFNEELTATKENDFFNKRSVDYSKKQKQITSDDLF